MAFGFRRLAVSPHRRLVPRFKCRRCKFARLPVQSYAPALEWLTTPRIQLRIVLCR
jgi:hypothetical protein